MDMRRLQAVNRAEPMSWRLGIVTPSMLWERLAWTERLASQMDETRRRVTPWAFCQVARRTVDTTDSKSYTVTDVQKVLGIAPKTHALKRSCWGHTDYSCHGLLSASCRVCHISLIRALTLTRHIEHMHCRMLCQKASCKKKKLKLLWGRIPFHGF